MRSAVVRGWFGLSCNASKVRIASISKSDASGNIIAFDLTGGEAFDGRHLETLLDIGPDIQPRAVICDKGYASKANRDTARKRRIAPVIPHKANERDKPAFFAAPSTRPARASSRAWDGSSASSAPRFAVKNRTKLQINRQFRRRLMLDQIRPHSLIAKRCLHKRDRYRCGGSSGTGLTADKLCAKE